MCGIVAVLRRPCQRPAPGARVVLEGVDAAWAAVRSQGSLAEAAARLEQVDLALRGTAGVRALLGDPALARELDARLSAFDEAVAAVERALDADELSLPPQELEGTNAALVRIKDAVWALRHDRLRTARAVAELAGDGAGAAAVEAFHSIQVALSAIDRLEVRGRDSAGIHVLVQGHGLDLDSPSTVALLGGRADDPLFTSMAVRAPAGHLAFVYKAAAEIGELGDNTRGLRAAITADDALRAALGADTARVAVLGHTRWASVGIISQVNAHPLNHEEEGSRDGPYVAAALNGDVDNYAELKASAGLRFPAEVTTDAKVIPTLVSRSIRKGQDAEAAFRSTAAACEGSVAVAAVAADAPDRLLLALRGSGQALYVGMAEDSYVVASEPYGLVEETSRYLRMDGEAAPTGSPGQIVVLHGPGAGSLGGVARTTYDGTPLPVHPEEIHTAEITTRDIDRAGYPHYLLKEISQAPESFRKTLRGKIQPRADGTLGVVLAEDSLPDSLRQRLRIGSVRRLFVVGQGTAAVAGQSLAAVLGGCLGESSVTVEALPATELSGFGLTDDMSDALLIAVSQSGTTTDTNRTVDLARARGATVVSIVNRRNSDLVERSHGVLYTSDGRDVEMSVASTKAFYAQVAAGILLSVALAEELGCADRRHAHELLEGTRQLPAAMEQVIARREAIASAAQRHAPSRRYWAVVGNGLNGIAAREVRIKLSELCYKAVACDATEDKKHIDLSSEPMVVVCGAGLAGPNAQDVAKEVAIYQAHKAAPVVIATEGEARLATAPQVIEVPAAHPSLAFLLSAMAGHLFGYEAALAIDAQARPLREMRAAVEAVVSSLERGADPLPRLASLIEPAASRFLSELRAGSYDGHLEASTAARVVSLLRYPLGTGALEGYEVEFGKRGTPGVVVEDLTAALTRGIEELTRPVDAIKHQAKTVTVGISRSEEALFAVPLVEQVLAAGVGRDRLSYRALRTLDALGPAVAEVTGFTRYRVESGAPGRRGTIHVVGQGGVGRT
ncbi:MAG TPA: SIS domain-containing protein, partial [Acidimicrobiales bacterium]|nr:SIS domain-containing protein [Acidimicrobiales bacterium]